ncbi:hypothetical protein [Methanotorris igneus]|uniref:Uncharacterized protein n=1 Tax=Methanotorris igneus (strain DSM 5666 / JCM 11834 / Kol 5) TaxID=880724 RepID=F6BBY9_METIK|nr:hypothetical protein [Methanotorris igneus]AEF96070.1 hypothetical protein Metig_0514 [Methanotorris igneus Kol 5]
MEVEGLLSRLVNEVERAKSDYHNGDEIGFLTHLTNAEGLIREIITLHNIMKGEKGYDAIFIK